MKNIPKIKSVRPMNDMIISVTFENSVTKLYDVKQLLERFPLFNELKNYNLFKLVKVDKGGFGLIWNEEIDISEYEVWENGRILKD